MNAEKVLEYAFTRDHEWIAPQLPDEAPFGITDYAQDALGDVVYINLPRVGQIVSVGDPICEIESVKSVVDLQAPVSCEVVGINTSLEAHPELLNQSPYEAGWIATLRVTEPADLRLLTTFIGYKADVLQEIEHVLVLDEANRIRYFPAVRTDEGLIVADSAQLRTVVAAGFVNVDTLRDLEVAEEFEYLINSRGLTEAAMQDFFVRHPDFLLGSDYEAAYPQVTLRSSGHEDLRPDFILKPLAGVSYDANIVELKLPGDRIIKPTPRRVGLYARIHDAVAQLRTYARYFEESENREYVRKTLGFSAMVPRLTLVIGRSIEVENNIDVRAAIGALAPVQLVTYGDLLYRYRRSIGRR
ncbi:MAG: glycine cleavage system protein [Frankiaceae bacterium]|jgi:glycine cleavage system H protein|nr:glycine cleavage system protein [Frankiaceae bacterium]